MWAIPYINQLRARTGDNRKRKYDMLIRWRLSDEDISEHRLSLMPDPGIDPVIKPKY